MAGSLRLKVRKASTVKNQVGKLRLYKSVLSACDLRRLACRYTLRSDDSIATQTLVKCGGPASATSGEERWRQHYKRELDGVEWSVACAALEATRHRSTQVKSSGGVTRVGVTRGGNWRCHPYFLLKK